ncbi:MAG: DUF2520 domain-containing protein [Prevotellaceae bacterium]|jgi:predicted short-subunit dehydrogenase-like oxidoreductase (DUF2520 family)|nr:DUF2520 domain-containing protein [Prevotellaceae bacterium]
MNEDMNVPTNHPSIALIGAGNLAVNLAPALSDSGFRIRQVYSRTQEAARSLARRVGAGYTTSPAEITPHADLYITALADSALPVLAPVIASVNPQALFVHTAGSIPMDIWKGHAARQGVLYPMQTFSKQREVDFGQIPIFVESNSPEDEALLRAVASRLSRQVYAATTEQRRSLHLAAVFACNFTNCLYTLASDILQAHHLPFDVMLPLIDETARKVHTLAPRQAQTGPAARGDRAVMAAHLEMLATHPGWQELYRTMSKMISDASQ